MKRVLTDQEYKKKKGKKSFQDPTYKILSFFLVHTVLPSVNAQLLRGISARYILGDKARRLSEFN